MNRLIVLLMVFTFLAACSFPQFTRYTHQDIEWGQDQLTGIDVGDKVSVVRSDREVFKFTVTGITESSIQGEGVEIRFDEIDSVSKKEIDRSEVKSFGWSLLVGFILAIAVMGYYMPLA